MAIGDLISEIDKLPRIKVGNSNSPTVKYCIDEVLLYDLLECYKAQNTLEWIPVSKKLPEGGGNYFVTVFDPVKKDTFVTDAEYSCKDGSWAGDYLHFWQRVTAWMPLPEPYKESEDKE